MEFVLRRADDPNFRWDRELIVGIHDRVLGGDFSLGAGRLRTGQRWIANSRSGETVFLPPSGHDVPSLVDQACEQLSAAGWHPAVAAAWIHLAVAAIHPFADGNGRCARVMASLAMYRGGFKKPEFTSLEEWWGRHVAEYYAAFGCLGSSFDLNADVTAFIESHLQAQVNQVRELERREEINRQLWMALTEVVDTASLPSRLTDAVWEVFFDRPVTAGYYRAVADVSPATATNDLAAAVASRLLGARGERRGRRYVVGSGLLPALGAILEVAGNELSPRRDEILAAIVRRLALPETPYGPNGREVEGILEAVSAIQSADLKALDEAWFDAIHDAGLASMSSAWSKAIAATDKNVFLRTARDNAHAKLEALRERLSSGFVVPSGAHEALWHALLAAVARGSIGVEDHLVLTGPFSTCRLDRRRGAADHPK
jgi:Fic family protein